MRKLSSIVGLSVISIAEGVDLGRVSEVVVDLAEGTVVGVIIASGADEKGVLVDDIAVIGPDAVMIADTSKTQDLAKVPTLADKRRPAAEKPMTVVTASGVKLGALAEVHVSPDTKQVVSYEVSGGPVRDLTDGTLSLAVAEGMVHGPDTVIVPDTVVADLDQQVGGLKGAWAQIARTAKEDYKGASERAGELYGRSAEGLKGAVDRAKTKSREVSKAIGQKIDQAREAARAGKEQQDTATAEVETDDTEQVAEQDKADDAETSESGEE